MILRKETVDTYKGYKIRIKEQEPSVKEPETEEEWDKLLENDTGDIRGTYKYRVENPNGEVIWEDHINMWCESACYDNGIDDIENDLKGNLTPTENIEVNNV